MISTKHKDQTFSAFSFAIPQNSCTFAPEFLWGLLRTEKSVRRDAKLVNGNLENFKDTREHSENTVCLLQAWSMSLYFCLKVIPEPVLKNVEVTPCPVSVPLRQDRGTLLP